MRKLTKIAVVLTLLAAPATAQEMPEPQVRHYNAEIDGSGSIKVVPTQDGSDVGLELNPKVSGSRGDGGGKFLWTTDAVKKLASQDVYGVFTPSGDPIAWYSVPPGASVPSEAFTMFSEGTYVQKVGFVDDLLEGALPTEAEIRKAVETMLTRAAAAVCSASVRPTQFGTAIDVSAGVGVQGRFELNATWNTADVCG